MSSFHFTRHAEVRMSQRCLSASDVGLIERIGTEVENGYLVLEKDFQAFESELKQLRDKAKRLVGKRVVLQGRTIITTYHACRRDERRLLRQAKDKSS